MSVNMNVTSQPGMTSQSGMTSLLQFEPSGAESIEEMVKEKSRELFALCDKEGKGFINKVDMQRLHGELPLSDEQLRDVFDSLDNDGNGFLTFEEFCEGFGGFLGLNVSETSESFVEVDDEADFPQDVSNISKDEKLRLSHILERLEHDPSFNRERVGEIWNRMQEENDEIPIEQVIEIVLEELNEAKAEKVAMERKLKERATNHADEVRLLYEEMEFQINEERRKTVAEEVVRERALSMNLQNELKQKERELERISQRQVALEKQVQELSSGKLEVRSENAQLVQLNQSLAEELQNTQKDLEETKVHVEAIERQKLQREEREQAEEEARKLDLEKKSLLRQLEMLREVNRKLRDDKDEAQQRNKLQTSTPKQRPPLFTQGSNVGKYFPEAEKHSEVYSNLHNLEEVRNIQRPKFEVIDEEQVERVYESSISSKSDETLNNNQRKSSFSHPKMNNGEELHGRPKQSSLISLTRRNRDPVMMMSPEQFGNRALDASDEEDGKIDLRRHPSMSGLNHIDAVLDQHGNEPVPTPDRVYKVVFVGNSGVGKTSFIQQFVNSSFTSSISATIGVDYQMKTIRLDAQVIALQLWDTAGQERYRSITRQYFRKADGIVVIYDVTNEKSFLAVRNWMQSVREGADPSAIILLLGNKTDIATNKTRQVTPKEGAKLAEEYGAKFSETSAKSGEKIHSSMTLFACDLTKVEDEQKDSVLSLAASDDELKSSSCCGGKFS
uniref:ras and EF-hand domain-containing protein homolog isoform X2 n=1 Tax=Ciona intestinalis TaxID=7719 RepID=UPI000180C1FA|nr:ras and EF-hand domain-containing protein homolog isoform X2 [Ciona intestinalis]|eukprot:XP_026696430.1 ras and EF-hand domain-containing protein homolog isoform X2 [Ciona intestinalis]